VILNVFVYFQASMCRTSHKLLSKLYVISVIIGLIYILKVHYF